MASKGRDLGNIVSPKTGIAVTMSGDPIVLGVGNTEHLRITGSGLIGVNNSSPLYPLHFKNAMASTPSYIHLEVTGSNTVGGGGGIQFDTSASNSGSNNGLFLATIHGERSASDNGSNTLIFKTSKANVAGDDSVNSSPKTRMTIDEDGDVTISDGDLVIGTAGHGIDFSAQTGVSTTGASTSAELLDHYEEGSWTPVFYGADTAGTYTISNTSQSGYYTRIGNLVWIKCSMVDISTSSAGSGQLRIGGVPFVNHSNNSSHGTVNLDKFDLDDATVSLASRIPASANYIQIFQIRDNNTDSSMNVSDKTSDTSDIFITMLYTVV